MPSFLDRIYPRIRRYRFLWGWAKDAVTKAQCSARAAEWKTKGFRGAKLDICGGRNPYHPGEFLNVDIVNMPRVDLVFDITKSFPIDDGVIAEVFSAATLEHLRKPHVDHVLKECFRILQPGGQLRVSTPDIEAIAQGILEGEDLAITNQHLFGKYKSDQTEDYDLHRWMYPAPTMMQRLMELGYIRAEKIPMGDVPHDEKYNYLIRAFKPL
jgi:predicted SAM-dependent methyltransferase